MATPHCKKCGHIQLAHTGKAGQFSPIPGTAVHLSQGWCLECPPSNPCMEFKEK